MSEPQQQFACGFIGLGSQGGPIARRMIEAGFPTLLWARRPRTLEPFEQTGANFAASVEELARASRYVGVCVRDEANVLQVCRELIAGMAPGSIIAIHSTISPECCKTLAGEAAQRGIAVLDLPVSGGGAAAAAGKLTIMAGGEASLLAFVTPVLRSFASEIIPLGEVGAAQAAKLLNNSVLAANLGLARAALTIGATLGIDPGSLTAVFAHGTARSYALELVARHADIESAPFLNDLLQKVDMLDTIVDAETAGLKEITAAARFNRPH